MDFIIVKVFSNLNDAMINLDLSEETFSNVDFPVLKENFLTLNTKNPKYL